MKLKRFLALGMAIMLLAALAACGGPTPYQMVEQASEKLDSADSVAYDISMALAMTLPELGDEEISITMTGSVMQEKASENDYKLAMNTTTDMSAMGAGSVGMEMYYTDGYMYYNIPEAETQYKFAMSLEEAMKQIDAYTLDEIQEDMIKESSVTEEKGGKAVTMILDGSKITDMAANVLGDITPILGEDSGMNISDTPYTVYIDADGNITSTKMLLEFSISAQDMSINMSVDMIMDIAAVDDVTIELPDDLADYPELTMDELE